MSHGLPPEIRMGNDIARQFAHRGDAAPTLIAAHLEKFWEPGMIARLEGFVRDGQTADADPMLVASVAELDHTY